MVRFVLSLVNTIENAKENAAFLFMKVHLMTSKCASLTLALNLSFAGLFVLKSFMQARFVKLYLQVYEYLDLGIL